jgi:hypothetical protein
MTVRAAEQVFVHDCVFPLGFVCLKPGEHATFEPSPLINAEVRRLILHDPVPDSCDHWQIERLNFGDGEMVADHFPLPARVFNATAQDVGFARPPHLRRGKPAHVEVAFHGYTPTARLSLVAVCRPTDGVIFCWSCGASVWRDYPAPARCELCGHRQHDAEIPDPEDRWGD